MQFWALALDTFRESRNSKLFLVMLAISTAVGIALACIGIDEQGVSILFGAYHLRSDTLRAGTDFARAFYGFLVTNLLIELYIGWVGLALSLVATAGLFPAFLREGAVELLLSKPLSRWKLFLSKYVGSLSFVLIQSAYLVGLVIIVIGFRSGLWLWSCLWCIPLLVLMFSYLYSVCVLVSMRTQSVLTCLLITLLFWFATFVVQLGHSLLRMPLAFQAGQPVSTSGDESLGTFRRAVDVAYTVLPKTGEIAIIATKLTDSAEFTRVVHALGFEEILGKTPEERAQVAEAEAAEGAISIPFSIGTSLAFEAVVLGLGVWWFARRDF